MKNFTNKKIKVGIRGAGVMWSILARQLVMDTTWGAVNLERQTKKEPKILRARVTSKRGTTAAALKIFTEQKFDEIFKQAVRAAFNRGQELKKV